MTEMPQEQPDRAAPRDGGEPLVVHHLPGGLRSTLEAVLMVVDEPVPAADLPPNALRESLALQFDRVSAGWRAVTDPPQFVVGIRRRRLQPFGGGDHRGRDPGRPQGGRPRGRRR